jgi:four helix bundle protein
MNKTELQQRFVDFGVGCIHLTKHISNSYSGQHLSRQLVRSSTSPALNYAESISAESVSDFIHKLQICLKELRETAVCLLMIQKANLCRDMKGINKLRDECNQLIAILVKSSQTTKRRYKK